MTLHVNVLQTPATFATLDIRGRNPLAYRVILLLLRQDILFVLGAVHLVVDLPAHVLAAG
jgi:hypothetical protein